MGSRSGARGAEGSDAARLRGWVRVERVSRRWAKWKTGGTHMENDTNASPLGLSDWTDSSHSSCFTPSGPSPSGGTRT